jgi:hypothetical protein
MSDVDLLWLIKPNQSVSTLNDTSDTTLILIKSSQLVHSPLPFILFPQWLDFMTAPLQCIIDNTEDLGPVDGISAFEIPPLGSAENIQEVGTWIFCTVGHIPSGDCVYCAQRVA